jgi:hypothetical protein
MAVFLDVAACSLVEIDRSCAGICFLHRQGSEGSRYVGNITFYPATQCNNPEDNYLHDFFEHTCFCVSSVQCFVSSLYLFEAVISKTNPPN